MGNSNVFLAERRAKPVVEAPFDFTHLSVRSAQGRNKPFP